MQDVFKKIIDSLEQKADSIYEDKTVGARFIMLGDARKVVQEVAEEYNNGWIPVEERLPEEAFGCLVVVEDTEPMTGQDFETILPYFVGYDSGSWCDAEGQEIPFEVIAWQPLPEPYKPKGDLE